MTAERRGRRDGQSSRERGSDLEVRRVRVLILSGVGIAAVVALLLVVYFTPLMSVRKVVVVGLGAVPEEQVLQALGVAMGAPLLQVDTSAVALRVAGIPKVSSARVQREYPSTIRVTIVERLPIAFAERPDGTHLFDSGAVDFATEPPPPGVPRLVVQSPGPGDPSTVAALAVLEAMAPQLRGQVGEIAAQAPSSIILTLWDGRTVKWGTAESSDYKAAVAGPLLMQPGLVYDVTSPDLPTVK